MYWHLIQTSIIRLTREQAEDFINTTTLEPEQGELSEINSLTSGISAVYIVEKYNAYESLNDIIGRPQRAVDVENQQFAPSADSLKAIYGDSFYASTCAEKAEQDIRFFFPDGKICSNTKFS